MAWVLLIFSAILEAIWATALGMSNGFTVLWPTIIFLVAQIGSMWGLGIAAKQIPIGTAYAVWTGLGAALTVTYSMVTGNEVASVGKIIFISGIILAVVGLKVVPARAQTFVSEQPEQ